MTNGYSNLKPNIVLQTGTVFSAAMAASGAVPLACVTLVDLPAHPFSLKLEVTCQSGENLVFAFAPAHFPAFDTHLCGDKSAHTALIRFSAADFEIGYAYLHSLSALTEALLCVKAEIDGFAVSSEVKIQLLPSDEWLGIDSHPETLAAFVCPGSRAVQTLTDGIMHDTPLSALAEHTDSLREIVKNIRSGSMICAARDSYSPERRQRIKSHAALCIPNAVAATPMELALLFCACAERCGFMPTVAFATNLSGAVSLFCGVRAHRVQSGTGVLSESLSKVRSMLENGEMFLFDPSILSSAQSIDVSLAAVEAQGYFSKNGTRLLLVLDIGEARANGVAPFFADAEKAAAEADEAHGSARDVLASIYNGLSGSRIFKVLSGEFGGYDVLPLVGFAPERLTAGQPEAIGPMEISEKPARFASLADDFAAFALRDEKSIAYNKAELADIRAAYAAFGTRIQEKKYIVTGYYEKTFHEKASRMTFGRSPGFACYAIAGFLRVREKTDAKEYYLPLAFVRVCLERSFDYRFCPGEDAPLVNTLAADLLGVNDKTVHFPENVPDVLAFFEKAAESCKDSAYSEIRVIRETALIKADLSDFILWNHIGTNARTMLKNKHFTALLAGTQPEEPESENAENRLRPFVRYAPEAVKETLTGTGNALLSGGNASDKEDFLVNAAASTLADSKTMLILSQEPDFLNFAAQSLEKAGLSETVLRLDLCRSSEDIIRAVQTRLEALSALERTSAAPQLKNELDEIAARLKSYAERLTKTDPTFGVSALELVESFDNAYDMANAKPLLAVEQAALESLNGEKLDALFDMAERLVRRAHKTLAEVSLAEQAPLSSHPLALLSPEKVPDDAVLHEIYELIARILPALSEYRETFFEISPILGIKISDIRNLDALYTLNELYRLFISAREYDIPEGFAANGLSAFADSESRRSHAKKRMENIEYQLRFFSPELFEDVDSLLVGYRNADDDRPNFIKKFLVKKNHKDVLLQYVTPENRAEFAKHPVSDIYKLLDEYRNEKAAAGESDAPEDENAASLAALVGELKKLLVCLYPEEQADRHATDARLMKLFAFIEKLCADAGLSKKLTFARARFAQVYSENECMLEKLSALLGADFRTLSFETGILNYDGLSGFLKRVEENLPALPGWVDYLEEEKAAEPYLAAFCEYLRRVGIKPGTDRLFASSLLLPAVTYMLQKSGLEADWNAISRAKETYAPLAEKTAALLLETALQTHRQRVKHYAETESAQLFAEAGKTLSVTAFASKHHKHLLRVFPILLINTASIGPISRGECIADTAVCDDSDRLPLSLEAACAAKRLILLTHTSRPGPVARLIAKAGALRLAFRSQEAVLTSEALGQTTLCAAMLNGTMRFAADLANPQEAELCVTKALEMARSGSRTAIFAFTHGQCAYMRHLLCVTAENDKTVRERIETGLVTVRDAFEPCYERFSGAVFSFAAAADSEGNLCRAFCMGSTEEFRKALYASLQTVDGQAVLVTSLSAKELDLFGKRLTAARELYYALCFAVHGTAAFEASELRSVSVLDAALLAAENEGVPARGFLSCGADLVSLDGKRAYMYDVTNEKDLFERLDKAERLKKNGVSLTLVSPLDAVRQLSGQAEKA